MLDMPYIEAFLARVEGPCQTTGYIPCYKISGGTANYRGGPNPGNYRAMGASGVTIATGCDLGQTDFATLTGFGLAADFAHLYDPYYGKKKDRAIDALARRPLVVARDVAVATDQALHAGYLRQWVRPAYERASGAKFDELPKQAQAVVMSLCFQNGCSGLARKYARLWRQLVACEWQAASQHLLAECNEYKSRRQTEGRLLAELS